MQGSSVPLLAGPTVSMLASPRWTTNRVDVRHGSQPLRLSPLPAPTCSSSTRLGAITEQFNFIQSTSIRMTQLVQLP